MLVKTYGSAVFGIKAITVTVEVNIDQGVQFFMVGLPDNAVRESQQRIESALRTHGYRIVNQYMENHTEVTIQTLMAETDLQKIFTGSRFKPSK